MHKLVLQLPDELYSSLAKAAEDQDLTVEEFAEETLSQVIDVDEDAAADDEDDYYDPDDDVGDEDEDEDEDWDDDDAYDDDDR